MNKVVVGLLFVLAFAIIFNSFVVAEENDSNKDNSGSSDSGSSDNSVEVEVKSETEVKDGEVRTKEEKRIKTKDGEIRERNEFRVKISEEEKRKIHQEKNRLKADSGECPTGCECASSTIKCVVNGTREMTIHAGNSGNVIIQTKKINASTEVELYRENGTLYGKFGNETRPIKVLPDEVKMKIKERIKAKLENESIHLEEDGTYKIKAKKKSRLFFLIPISENIEADIDAETGEFIVVKRPWWGFVAKDEVETASDIEEELEIKAETFNGTSEVKIELEFGTSETEQEMIVTEILTRLSNLNISNLLEIKEEDEVGKNEEKLEVEAEIEESFTKVEFEWKFLVNSDNREKIIDVIKTRLSGLTAESINNNFVLETEDDELDENDDDELEEEDEDTNNSS